jgi:hypothetical protein
VFLSPGRGAALVRSAPDGWCEGLPVLVWMVAPMVYPRVVAPHRRRVRARPVTL